MARVYETVTVLCLLGTLVLGMTYVLSALLDYQNSSLHTLLSKYIYYIYNLDIKTIKLRQGYRSNVICFTDLWSYYLPFLYSCVSFVGVVMLLRKYRVYSCNSIMHTAEKNQYVIFFKRINFFREVALIREFLYP